MRFTSRDAIWLQRLGRALVNTTGSTIMHLADVIRGVKFENGVRVDINDSRVAA